VVLVHVKMGKRLKKKVRGHYKHPAVVGCVVYVVCVCVVCMCVV